MDPNTLRVKILCRVAEQEGYIGDEALAAAIGVPKLALQRQLDILGDDGLLELHKTFDPGAARPTATVRLTSKGMLAVERLTEAPDKPKPPIGF